MTLNELDGATRRLATITEVAELAGVSTSTVSRYLRGERVQRESDVAAAVKTLNYRPNAAARGLRSRQSHAIAIVVHDITNPFLAAVVQGAHSVATDHRYKLYLAEGNDAAEEAIDELASRVDGFICAAATDGSEVLSALHARGRPAVLLEFEPRDKDHGFDVVVVQDEVGANDAITHLITLGHSRIAVITGPEGTSPGRNRLAGAHAALDTAGIKLLPGYLEVSDFSWAGGYQATARLMGRTPAPTALFVANNLMSLGALHCLHELGIRLPEDMSFVGFDPLPSCDLFRAPPTTVERPEVAQGALAMRLLEGRISGHVVGAARRIAMETHLEKRASSGPPPSTPR